MQLIRSALVVAFVLVAGNASAQMTIRGNYWRDRNTRVLNPTVDLSKEFKSGTIVGASYLLDAITSASVAAGAVRDEPFTELRNELGFRLAQRVGPALLNASYSYSAESDYWAHTISTGASVDLFKKNTTLALQITYGLDKVGARASSTTFTPIGGLQRVHIAASWSQVLTRTLIANLGYQIGIIGFGSELGGTGGDPNSDTGTQSNPYRTVLVAGNPVREKNPNQRIRQAVDINLHWAIPLRSRLVPYLAFRPAYRLYWDDWGVLSNTPELRTFLPVGPVEFRFTARYYTQQEASFWRDVGGRPQYSNEGVNCYTCTLASARDKNAKFYTGDPKLSDFNSYFFELRTALKLEGLRRFKKLPLHDWLADGILELSYGYYINDKYVYTSFGNSHVAGLGLIFPL